MGNRASWTFRILFLLLILAALAASIFFLRSRWRALVQGYGRLVEGGDPSLTLPERVYLQTYLSTRIEQLSQPAGTGQLPVPFVIAPGERADQIATNLSQAGLLSEKELFIRYVRFHGLDSELEAGEFVLSPTLTIPELADAITESYARDIELRFLEGWRMEEMAAYLDAIRPAEIDGSEFLEIARLQRSFDISNHGFLASLPAGSTLEGYLFPDTYLVPLDADAVYLVDHMLSNFGRRVTPSMRQAFGATGLSLREAVAMASIIEREAVVPDERPLIASVFFNRLSQGMKLEADPTVQYALGYQPSFDSWWKSPLTIDDLKVNSSYNTYVYEGLPPGPIANPGLSSLESVANPDSSDFLFFVVDCHATIPGSHVFSTTFEEHLARVQRCR